MTARDDAIDEEEERAWATAHARAFLAPRGPAPTCEGPRPVEHPAQASVRAGQAARLHAARAYRQAGGDPVEELSTLLPLPLSMLAPERAEEQEEEERDG